MTTVHTQVGYRLIKISDGSVVAYWGPSYPPSQIPTIVTLPTGEIVSNPQVDLEYFGYKLVIWIDDVELPVQKVFDAEPWILRFSSAEFNAVHTSTDTVIRRFWDIFLAKGSIDVTSPLALLAKAEFVEQGLLTSERALIIWDTVPSSIVITPTGGP